MFCLPRRAFTLVELLVVVAICGMLIAMLLPAVQSARHAALKSKLGSSPEYGPGEPAAPAGQAEAAARLPVARVQAFSAEIELTPRLSVGTAAPESIYEAHFAGKIQAVGPRDPKEKSGECEIELPLPPQIISLADLSIKTADQPSEKVVLRGNKLLWRGNLPSEPTSLDITYTAVGKGLYELAVPPGGILDQFQISLVANGSDVRLLELSLQPTSLERSGGTSTYKWEYQRLLFGRPVRLDVLGIAPIDRLGELTWLGPLSVIVFGLLVGLVVHAAAVERFDLWILLLTVGTFAGAYPLMYFAQEYISLGPAVALSAGIALVIIAVRAVTLMSLRLALFGIVLPAAAIMGLTLVAAVWTSLQGILLTAAALGFFIAVMMLMPKIRFAGTASPAAAANPPASPVAPTGSRDATGVIEPRHDSDSGGTKGPSQNP